MKDMKLKIVSAVIILLLLIILVPAAIVLISDTEFKGYGSFLENDSLSSSIVFLPDTQDPIWIETLWLDEKDNVEIKKSIFNKITILKPKAIFHLGDLTALGFINREWKEVDNWINILNGNGIRFHPVLGNHELMLLPDLGYANFIDRFPEFSNTGYVAILDSLAVILLNSNFGNMTSREIAYQNEWYIDIITKLDRDENINLVIVGCHHSPYTNSTIVNPSEEVRKNFVPAYLQSKKARLFVSGHAHAFEHFIIEEKFFVVVGGGGGLQQPLLTGSDALWPDEFNSHEMIRRFHFASLEKNADGYSFIVNMIDSTYSYFENIYSIML
jgi:hypothetical protein